MGRVLVFVFAALVSAQAFGQNPQRVVVSKEAMTLTVFDAAGDTLANYPVALGKNPGQKQKVGDMRTPEGVFKVVQIQDSTLWEHDFGDGKGSIKGAYGPWFVRLATPPHRGIGIHGTHDPSSIGTRATEGCIRLNNNDLLEFVRLVHVGLPVEITED